MKKHFITGLVILLPLTLTIWLVSFVFNFLTDPFVGIFQSIFDYFDLMESSFLFFSAAEVQQIASKICIAIFFFFFTILLGILGRWVLVKYLFKVWDSIVHRIPIVRTIYKTCQDVSTTLFTSQANSFKQVVLTPFPNKETLTIGFVTKENLQNLKHSEKNNLTAVFVPTTPNPTSGYIMLFPEDELVYLDMKVEDAFKYIISCGVIVTPLKSITLEESRRTINNQLQAVEK